MVVVNTLSFSSSHYKHLFQLIGKEHDKLDISVSLYWNFDTSILTEVVNKISYWQNQCTTN